MKVTYKNHYGSDLLDKVEDAMWDALDEGSFGWGVEAGDLVAQLAVLALKAVEDHQNEIEKQEETL